MPKPTCIYFGPLRGEGIHRLSLAASTIVNTYFRVINGHIRKDAVKADVVISFLSDKILKGPILDNETINFHPAPPKYPGRGGASYALFNGDTTYGATAHKMVTAVDAGEIYGVSEFNIRDDETCESLFEQAENACLLLLTQFCMEYNANRQMPKFLLDECWSGPAKTKKDFQEFMKLPSVESLLCGSESYQDWHTTEIEQKIRACKHSKFPGPFIDVMGHKFELSKDDKRC